MLYNVCINVQYDARYSFDHFVPEPTEFLVVATQNNTHVNITLPPDLYGTVTIVNFGEMTYGYGDIFIVTLQAYETAQVC